MRACFRGSHFYWYHGMLFSNGSKQLFMIKILPLLAFILIIGCKKDKDPVPTGNSYVNQDEYFVLQASIVNYTSIQLSHVAGSISSDSAILAFADLIVTEHTIYRQHLIDLSDSVTMQVADSLDPQHLTLRNHLLTISGREFDSTYIHNLVQDLGTAISLHQTEMSAGSNAQVKVFATIHLGEIQTRKMWADSVAANY